MRQPPRFKLELGKYAVKNLTRKFNGLEFWLDLGGPKMKIHIPFDADVREGDLLTLYTEVLADAKGSRAQGH